MERPAETTHASFQDVRDALVLAWPTHSDSALSIAAQVVICSHSAFETGEWRSMMNNNIGNAKASPSQGRDYTYFSTKEYLPTHVAEVVLRKSTDECPCKSVAVLDGTTVVQFYPKHPTCCFRSFETLADGMEDHLRLLSGRYSTAYAFADKADVAGYAKCIHSLGYFTGPLVGYINGMNRYFDKFAQIQLGVSDLMSWQREHGLECDGIIGPFTRGKLQECLRNLELG